MAKSTTMTPEAYARLAAAFQKYPGQISQAAREANLPKHAAYTGWHEGWKGLRLPPLNPQAALSEVLIQQARLDQAKAETEADIARRLIADAASKAALEATAKEAAREAKAQLDARADNRDDAAKVLDEERKLRVGARSVAGQNIIASAAWGKSVRLVSETLIAKIEAERKGMTREELADIARTMALVDRSRMALLREAIELERLHRGDPSQILGITPVEMNTEEAIKEIEEGVADLRRYRRQAQQLMAVDAEPVGPTIDVTPGQ